MPPTTRDGSTYFGLRFGIKLHQYSHDLSAGISKNICLHLAQLRFFAYTTAQYAFWNIPASSRTPVETNLERIIVLKHWQALLIIIMYVEVAERPAILFKQTSVQRSLIVTSHTDRII